MDGLQTRVSGSINIDPVVVSDIKGLGRRDVHASAGLYEGLWCRLGVVGQFGAKNPVQKWFESYSVDFRQLLVVVPLVMTPTSMPMARRLRRTGATSGNAVQAAS